MLTRWQAYQAFCKRIWIKNEASAHYRIGDGYGAFLMPKSGDDLNNKIRRKYL